MHDQAPQGAMTIEPDGPVYEVERRIEANQSQPRYSTVLSDDDIASRKHRRIVGGRWEEIGTLQRDFLISRGLHPNMKLLDVGCGSLRAGTLLVDYLEPGNYFGVDINPSIIEAGYNFELDDVARDRLPIGNLRATDRFDVDFGVTFDMAIANSVFTHISLNHIRLCLFRLAEVMSPGGRFFATFFEREETFPVDGSFGQPPNRRFTERNVFWYYATDLTWAASRLPFEVDYVGAWGHPRDQRMIEYTRI